MQHAPALHIEIVDFVGRFQRSVEDFRISRSRDKAVRRTVRALARLTDSELHDIGVARDQITAVARSCSV
jgi:uncharacterized protein YjiS (DUF1127 family)